MKTPPIVSPQEWQSAWEQMLAKEKAHTRARDALAAERRRMPWRRTTASRVRTDRQAWRICSRGVGS